MSALNAPATMNAVGVYVNAVDVEPVQRKKENPKLSENHKLMAQAIEQEDKEVEVGRTFFQTRHLRYIPVPHRTIRVSRRIVRSGKRWTRTIRCFTQTPSNSIPPSNSSIQSSTVRRCKHRLNTTARSEKNNERYDHKRQGHFIKQLLFVVCDVTYVWFAGSEFLDRM